MCLLAIKQVGNGRWDVVVEFVEVGFSFVFSRTARQSLLTISVKPGTKCVDDSTVGVRIIAKVDTMTTPRENEIWYRNEGIRAPRTKM